jgi:hypothetical protein
MDIMYVHIIVKLSKSLKLNKIKSQNTLRKENNITNNLYQTFEYFKIGRRHFCAPLPKADTFNKGKVCPSLTFTNLTDGMVRYTL